MAGPRTDESGRIKKPDAPNGNGEKAPEPVVLARRAIEGMKAEIAKALPRHITGERMTRVLLTALSTTPDLALCTKESFFGAILQASQLGLEPNTPLGHAWLLPYRNKKRGVTECQLQIGYQGMMDLSMRTGRVHGFSAEAVREGDFFEYELGLYPKCRHIPSDDPDREDKPITHVYGVVRVKDADPAFRVLTLAQVRARAMRSATWDHSKNAPGSGPWLTDFEAMCLKTALRAVWKFAPKSPEMARVEALEVAAEKGDSQAAYFSDTVKEALERQGVQPIYANPPEQTQQQPQSGLIGDDEPDGFPIEQDPVTGEIRERATAPA